MHCDFSDFLGNCWKLFLTNHLISSVGLKMFLHLLTPNKEGQLPTCTHVLHKTLLNMTLKDTRNLPLNIIDLIIMELVSYKSMTSCDLMSN